jgi:hypothetical protein
MADEDDGFKVWHVLFLIWMVVSAICVAVGIGPILLVIFIISTAINGIAGLFLLGNSINGDD